MPRSVFHSVAVLFLITLVSCTDRAEPPPGSETMPRVDHEKVRQAVRDYLFWTYSARYIEQLDLAYSEPEEADGKAADLVVHAKYAFSTRDGGRVHSLTRGEERLRLQKTEYGYRVLELKQQRLL